MICDRCYQERPIVGKITSDVLDDYVCWPCFEDAYRLIGLNRKARQGKIEIEAIN